MPKIFAFNARAFIPFLVQYWFLFFFFFFVITYFFFFFFFLNFILKNLTKMLSLYYFQDVPLYCISNVCGRIRTTYSIRTTSRLNPFRQPVTWRCELKSGLFVVSDVYRPENSEQGMHSTGLTCVAVCITRHWLVLLFNGLSSLDGRASDSGRGGLDCKVDGSNPVMDCWKF